MGIRKNKRKRYKQFCKAYGLDHFMGERYYDIEPIFVNKERNWSIYVTNMILCDLKMPYFLVYNNVDFLYASKCCKISMISPNYIGYSSGSKQYWKLNDEEIEWLNTTLRLELNVSNDLLMYTNKFISEESTVWDSILYYMSNQSGYNYFDIPIIEYHDISFGGNIYLDKEPEPWTHSVLYKELSGYNELRTKQIWRDSKCSKEAEDKHMQKVRKELLRKSILKEE